MLTTYTKQDDIPESLREHYKLIEGRWVAELSTDHPVLVNNAALKTEKAEVETKLVNAQTELTTAKADLETARSSGLPRGTEAIPKTKADLIRAVEAAGITTPEAFQTLQTEHGDYKQKAEAAEKARHVASVAEAMEWDRDKTERQAAKVYDFSGLEVRTGDDGKKTVIAKVKGTGDALVEKLFADVVKVTPELSDLLPILTATTDGGTPLPSHGAGGGSQKPNPADSYLASVDKAPQPKALAA